VATAVQLTQPRTIFFPYNRWSESGSTISAFNEVTNFPASNTKLQQRSKIYRSTNLTTPHLQADLGQSRKISGICFVSHNMSKDATWRIRVSNSSDMSSPSIDKTGLNVWEPFLPTDSEWSDGTGKPSADMIAMLEFCAENPRVVRWETFGEVEGRYVRLDFSDAGNPDTYIEVAWCYAGIAVELDVRHVYGWKAWVEDNVRRHISATGQHWTDIHNRKIMATASFRAQPEDFAMAFWNFLSEKLGVSNELVVAIKEDGFASKFWLSVYCRLESISPQQQEAVGSFENALKIEELSG
jgi:hypothetical protein